MSFEWPAVLLAVLLVPAFVGFYVRALRRRRRYSLRFTNVEVLAQVAAGTRAWRRHVPATLFLVALAAVTVGMARPHVEVVRADERATVLLVLDTSRSMQQSDVRPSRLAAAKRAAQVFLDEIPDRLRIGVLTFAGDVSVNVPPTSDHALARDAIRLVSTYRAFGFGGGTAIGDAVARAVQVGREAVPGGDARELVSILFLSDGRQYRGVLPPMAGAERAREAGIPVFTVALGTPGGQGGPAPPTGFNTFRAPDPATLRAIARRTGGKFYEARTARSVVEAYRELGSRLGRSRARDEVTHAFLAGAAAMLLAAGAFSVRWAARLP